MRYSATDNNSVSVAGAEPKTIRVIINLHDAHSKHDEQKEKDNNKKIEADIDLSWTSDKILKEFVRNHVDDRDEDKRTKHALYYAYKGVGEKKETRIMFPFERKLDDFRVQDVADSVPKEYDILSQETLELHCTECMFNMLCPRLFLGNGSSNVLNHLFDSLL